jgi:hypothetical protein
VGSIEYLNVVYTIWSPYREPPELDPLKGTRHQNPNPL